MTKLYIGARLMLAPFAPTQQRVSSCKTIKKDLQYPCTVVYINRPHRYFTVRFDFQYGSFLESFKFHEPGDCP